MFLRKSLIARAVLVGSMTLSGTVVAAPVRIALIEGLSGPYGGVGQVTLQQYRVIAGIATENRWAGADAPVEVEGFDGRNDPAASLVQLRKAIDAGYRYIAQGSSATVARVLSDAIGMHNAAHPGAEVLLLNHSATDPELTGAACSPWHFHFDANLTQRTDAVVAWVERHRGWRSIGLINPDTAGGRDLAQRLRTALESSRRGIRVVSTIQHPVGAEGEASAARAATRAMGAGATALITVSTGNDLIGMVRSASAAAGDVPVLALDAAAPGLEAALGHSQSGALMRIDPDQPERGVFAASSLQRDLRAAGTDLNGSVPVWHAIRFLTASVRKVARDLPTDRAPDVNDVADTLASMRMGGLYGPVRMRAADRQLEQPLAVHAWRGKQGWDTRTVFPAAAEKPAQTCRMNASARSATHRERAPR